MHSENACSKGKGVAGGGKGNAKGKRNVKGKIGGEEEWRIELPPPVPQRTPFVSLEAQDIPLREDGLWDIAALAACDKPTVYHGALDPALCDPDTWLALSEDDKVIVLMPGERGENHNAFSVKRSGWESGHKQEQHTAAASTFDPEHGSHGVPPVHAARWHARWRLDLQSPATAAIFPSRIPIVADSIMSITNMFYAAPCTRTPLHKDKETSFLLHLQGVKSVLCFSQDEVNLDPRLPAGVKGNGQTQNFSVSGDQAAIFGGERPLTEGGGDKLLHYGGWHHMLAPRDLLVIPAGLYHDIESTEGQCTLSCALRLRY